MKQQRLFLFSKLSCLPLRIMTGLPSVVRLLPPLPTHAGSPHKKETLSYHAVGLEQLMDIEVPTVDGAARRFERKLTDAGLWAGVFPASQAAKRCRPMTRGRNR